MMAKLTKALRKAILDDFMASNNGWFEPGAFARWVREQGPEHPAYPWFTFDVQKAAEKCWADEARAFVSGLRIKFDVNVIEHGVGKIISREVPLFVSPKDKRPGGGGYYKNDPTDPEHLAELANQAASDLGWFLRRYAAPLAAVGADVDALEELRVQLAAMKDSEAA